MITRRNTVSQCPRLEDLEARRFLSTTAWSADVPRTIRDLRTMRSNLDVSGMSGTIEDVNVRLNITHTYDADLDVFLIAPDGTRVELFTDVGSSANHFTNTRLDDQAGRRITRGSAPFNGRFRPEGSLADFRDLDPNGRWRLEIRDDARRNTGRLNSWSIELTTADPVPDDGAGNTMGEARQINLGPAAQSFYDFVGAVDTVDYYRFDLDSRSDFYLNLDGMVADADVALLDSQGNWLAGSTYGGSTAESITQMLESGTYFIRVYPFGAANTDYVITVSAVALPSGDGFEDDDAPADARSIENGVPHLHSIHTIGDQDWVTFTLQQRSNVVITTDGTSGDTELWLYSAADTVNSIQYDDDGGNVLFSNITTTLDAGTYYVKVSAYRDASAIDEYMLSFTATSSGGDWFSQNLFDAGIISAARNAYADSQISRNEMISILRNGEDGGVINFNELHDYRALVAAGSVTMPEYVRMLANNVVNSNVANQWYQGSSMGDLSENSGSSHLENLIGKWFHGTDHPQASASYQIISGSLFQNGASYEDIRQGSVGDCYYVAALGALALRSPSSIQDMFIDNGDGTFTVRFFNGSDAQYVTVDRSLPTYSWGSRVYASWGEGDPGDHANELWVALAEKAYVQMNECGWTGQEGQNSYESIAGGWPGDVLQQITGLSASTSFTLDHAEMVSAFNAGRPICLATVWSPPDPQVVGNHAYTLVDYDARTDTFSLFNPWGLNNGHDAGVIQLSWSALTANYFAWDQQMSTAPAVASRSVFAEQAMADLLDGSDDILAIAVASGMAT